MVRFSKTCHEGEIIHQLGGTRESTGCAEIWQLLSEMFFCLHPEFVSRKDDHQAIMCPKSDSSHDCTREYLINLEYIHTY